MKETREVKKAQMMARLEKAVDELLDWEAQHPRPTLRQLEDIILELRRQIGEEMADEVLERMEGRTPVPGPACPKCGKEMRYKGETRSKWKAGQARSSTSEDTMPVRSVKQGFFPLDEQLGLQDSHWSEGIAKQAIWLSGLVTYENAARVLQLHMCAAHSAGGRGDSAASPVHTCVDAR